VSPTVPVVFSCDRGYVTLAAISILSLIKNRDKNSSLEIFVLGNKLREKDIAWLKNLEKSGENCKITPLNVDFSPLKGCAVGKWGICANARLVISKMELFRDYQQALYVDCDTLAVADISDLLNLDLKDFHLAAVVDPGLVAIDFGIRLQLPDPKKYFNSGVVVMNLRQIRSEGIDDRWIEIMKNKKRFHLKCLDQDALNITSSEKYLPLDRSYNAFSRVKSECMECKIIHYSGSGKPWGKCTGWQRDVYKKFVMENGDRKMKLFLFRKCALYKMCRAVKHFFRNIGKLFPRKVFYPLRNFWRNICRAR
jgi:lipopolysaccharide biosynthesis glycosyltransferase